MHSAGRPYSAAGKGGTWHLSCSLKDERPMTHGIMEGTTSRGPNMSKGMKCPEWGRGGWDVRQGPKCEGNGGTLDLPLWGLQESGLEGGASLD